jgi:hypothetical protein
VVGNLNVASRRSTVRTRRCYYSPRRDHVDSTTVVVRRAAEGVHDASNAPFCALVLQSAGTIEEGRSGADESEGCVLLRV